MKWLITADLHLTDRPQDEYRWEIFEWLRIQAENRNVDRILILGDITDRKDHHSAQLVNRVVKNFMSLPCPYYATMGNHDYVDPKTPFFDFIELIRVPTRIEIGNKNCLFLPHLKDWAAASAWRRAYPFSGLDREWDFIFCHNTFDGAQSSSGFALPGPSTGVFNNTSAIVISGDVHVPQQVGPVTYVGSPHPVAFGDTFKPRVLFWDSEKMYSIERTTLRRETLRIRDPHEILDSDMTEGDHVKVELTLPRSELVDWDDYRQLAIENCDERGFVLFGVSLKVKEPVKRKQVGEPEVKDSTQDPKDVIQVFCSERGLDQSYIDAAVELTDADS